MVKKISLKNITIIIILLLVIGYILLRIPTSFNKSFTGLRYRLGVENADKYEETTVVFKGKIEKDFWLNKKFVGYVTIDNIEDLLNKKDNIEAFYNNKVELPFDRNKSAALVYHSFIDGKPELEFVGTLYFDSSFEKLTMAISEPVEGNSKSWSGDNGLMITAPVSSRSEAIEISNELMKARLYNDGEIYILK